MTTDDDGLHLRVLSLLPTARDGLLTAELLGRRGIQVTECRNDCDLATEVARGVGAIIVAEEVLAEGAHGVLMAAVRDQPRWSDLPVLLVTSSGPSSGPVEEAMGTLGNVTLMERPLRVAALVSTVHAALRARARQYQLQSYLSELERARKAEAEHAQRKDTFLAMLGHELRNPLAPIRNALQVLEIDDSDPARRKQLRQMMLRQVDHMVRLVDDLLEASRLSQGKITLQRVPVDLREVLRDAVALARRSRQEEDAPRVLLTLPEQPIPLDADPVRLAQVFGNLLNNAMRYGKAGGVVEVAARHDGDEAVAAVLDDGDGIEPELLPRLFELFSQGQRSQHRLHDGLGIGLALVHQLVAMHGGTVTGHSKGKGKGAEFLVRLPLAEPPRDPPPARAQASAPLDALAPRLKVLVVDDNRDAAQSMAMLLEAMDVDVAMAHAGEEALEQATRFHPDLALLDIGMPGMDGYTLARHLRERTADGGMVLAAMTGWGEERDRLRAREAGFDHHFSKPADIRVLGELLDELRRGLPRDRAIQSPP